MNDSPKSKAHPGQSTQVAEESLMATADNIREYSVQLINMAQANAESAFEFARQIAIAKAPSDLAEVWTSHASKQLSTITEQGERLAALGQKLAGQSAEPVARTVKQVLNKAC